MTLEGLYRRNVPGLAGVSRQINNTANDSYRLLDRREIVCVTGHGTSGSLYETIVRWYPLQFLIRPSRAAASHLAGTLNADRRSLRLPAG